ncbi:hypothetical protein Syun_016852 [Stephania yunnanensis]|uniref:Enolase N-terminal domain-containing protein n=1 Tax=Stephania yunnanensis TaxID=152371 RepID=A0AAP0J7F3_9MAGN
MVQQLDGTVNEWVGLGANAILAVSLAFCKARASVKKVPLYKGAPTNHVANAFCRSSRNPSSHMLTTSSVIPSLQCILQQNTVQRVCYE